ncbi:MAG: GntR family transcriptional regulator [Roseburia faecis]
MAIKYKWLAGHLREQLPDYTANGIHRLPTEAAISQRYKVSRQTVRQALSVLEQEGLIEKGREAVPISRDAAAEKTGSTFCFPVTLLICIRCFCMTSKNTCGTGLFHDCITSRKTPFPQNILFYRRFSTSRRAPCLWKVKLRARTRIWICTVNCRKRNALFSFLQESYPELTNCPCVTMDDFGGGICSPGICSPPAIPASVRSSCGYAFRTLALPGDAACPAGHRCTSGRFPDMLVFFR